MISPNLRDFLRSAAATNDFAASLTASWDRYGKLTERQHNAAVRMHEAAFRASQPAATVDLAPIRAMFDSAVAAGLKRPTYRAEGLILSLAPATGRNPGALYVKSGDDGRYLGKVTGTAYKGDAEATKGLEAIASDPLAAAVRYGRLTGSCSCCGRTLTDARSVTAGVGPICAARFGFAWGEVA